MIELTVRTLDSQSHKFSVDDGYTVLQFKEHIASTVNIAADTQRIIYSGRVLTDDSKLSELDVNGKVVHLVERPPPRTGQNNEPANRNATGNGPSVQPHPHRIVGGNAMYLGSMAIPLEPQNIVTPPPTFRLAASRLAVARRMLRRAEVAIAWLENPTAPRGSTAQADDAQVEVTPVFEARVVVPASSGEVVDDNLMNAVRSQILNNAENGSASATSLTQANETEANQQMEENNADPEGTQSATVTPEEASTPLSTSTEDLTGQSANGGNQGATNGPENIARTSEMADLLDTLARLQTRFAPFLFRYEQFMRDDPVVEEANNARAMDRTFQRTSEVLHYFSHAFHSLSDMIVRVRSAPPRRLVCRPILIQQTAVVPTGFPIQVEAQINFSSDMPMPPNSTSSSTQTAGDSARQTTASTPNASNVPATNGSSNGAPRPSMVTLPNIEFMNIPGLQPSAVHVQTIPIGIRTMRGNAGPRRLFTSTQNVSAQVANNANATNGGNAPTSNATGPTIINPNVEFFMEVTPESITIDSLDISNLGGAGAAEGARGPGMQAPPDFMQMMDWMTGRLVNRGASTSNPGTPATAATAAAQGNGNTTQTVSSTAAQANASGPNGVPGQNSQARGNTQTHPTTATHTRSTARPHVHFAQHAIQGFDPFLPCNSHHITHLRRPTVRSAMNNNQNQPNNNNLRPPNDSNAPNPMNPVMNLVQGLMNSLQNAYGRRAGSQSTGAQTGAAAQAAPPPPSGPTPVPNTEQPHPNMFSLLSGFPFPMGVANAGNSHGRGATIAQLLQQAGDQLTSEGLFGELILLLANNLSISDLMVLNTGRLDPLLRIRNEIRTFVNERILEGNGLSLQNMDRAVNKLLGEMQPFLDGLATMPVQGDVDIVRSTQMLFRMRLPRLIHLAISRRPNAMKDLVDQLKLIGEHFCGLILHASSTDHRGVQELMSRLAEPYMEGIAPDLLQWTQVAMRVQLQYYLLSINVPLSALQPYIVRNVDSIIASSSERAQSEPMEVDGTQVANEEEVVSDVLGVIDLRDTEDLPSVVIGSESWHGQVPADWVPIITRDSQRQRRQNQPLSDTYLSGMPSKRRKVVTNSKPHGSLPQVIRESIRRAVTTTGHAPVANLDTVAEEASADLALQTAYRDLLRSSVQSSIEDNADFTPERFPNASSYFSKSQ